MVLGWKDYRTIQEEWGRGENKGHLEEQITGLVRVGDLTKLM